MQVSLVSACFLFLFLIGVVHAQEASPSRITLLFEGNKVFSQEELLAITDKCLAATARPETYVDYCLWKLKFFLQSKGYLQANVGEPRHKKIDSGLQIIVPIGEGALFRLGKVEVRGSKILSPAQLLQMLDLKSGHIADGSALDSWLHEKVRLKYASLGYIQFAYEIQPTFHQQPDHPEGIVDFGITIDEGEMFTIASITFAGNGTLEGSELLRDLPLGNGDVFNRELFEQGLKRINERNQFEPIDTDKDVEYKTDKKRPQLHLTINLKRKTIQ